LDGVELGALVIGAAPRSLGLAHRGIPLHLNCGEQPLKLGDPDDPSAIRSVSASTGQAGPKLFDLCSQRRRLLERLVLAEIGHPSRFYCRV
jgi:hypothetical protein